MLNCIECGHQLVAKNKTYVANLDNCVIVIKNVPALVCEHCHEVYYTDDISEKIENITCKLKDIIDDIAVVDFKNRIA